MHRILAEPSIQAYDEALGHAEVKRAVERALDLARLSDEAPPYEALVGSIAARLEDVRMRELVPVINATGILLHTNLGRAPLAAEALAAIGEIGAGYSNLEFDLTAGERGSRYERLTGSVCALTGAADALIVNNCAAAVLLVLDTFARGREVVVARSQLVEIGGGFRLPDVLARSGAMLVEVGTTNRVYLHDYQRALSPRTALLLRTHPSNYAIEGFTHDPTARELVELGRRAGVAVVEDLGNGALVDLTEYGLPHERTVQEAIGDGVGLVTFSGDKLLGGPQAGIVVGRAELVARLRNNPLLRALRVDKLTLAALGATLALYRDRALRERLPIYRMLSATPDALRARAAAYLEKIPDARAGESQAYVGGGTLPRAAIRSLAVALTPEDPDAYAARLRRGHPPIVARIEDGRVLCDLRTILPEEDSAVIAALLRAGRATR